MTQTPHPDNDGHQDRRRESRGRDDRDRESRGRDDRDRENHGGDDREPETPTVERTGVLADDPTAPQATAERRWHALAQLMSVESRSLAPLVRMSPLPDGVALAHRLPLGSVPLASLRAAAPLRAGHVLTVALAVADALVDLEQHGLAHGGVSAQQVVVGPDGAVVIAGCGLAWRRPPGDVDGPRIVDDVAALGELVRDLLGAGSSPSSLVLAALRAADPDPGLRPTPLELTVLLRRCGRADPLLDLLWGGGARGAGDVVVEPTGPGVEKATVPQPRVSPPVAPAPVVPASSSRLRIDPRTAPDPGVVADARTWTEPVADAPEGDGAQGLDGRSLRGERVGRAESGARSPRPAPRRPGARRRPAARERRRAGRRGGPWVVVLVSVLAALTLGAVRVGARAMADGPAGEAAAAGVVTSSVATTGEVPTDPAVATTTEVPTGTLTATSSGAGVSPTESGAAAVGGSVDVDRGAVSTAPDWAALLAAADSGRQAALAAGDATALASWVDPDGSAWAADAALAARVTALGARIDGGALVVLDVRPRQVVASRAVLLVLDRRDAYTVTTATGTSSVPARAPRWWQVTLRRTTDSAGAVAWRVHDVAPIAAPKI